MKLVVSFQPEDMEKIAEGGWMDSRIDFCGGVLKDRLNK